MQKLLGKRKLGRTAAHRRALVKNQLRSLFQNGELKTTSQKAKVLKANAESLISKAREPKNELVMYRSMIDIFGNEKLAKSAIQYSKKELVAVHIVKVGFRDGDNARVSRVSLSSFDKPSKSTGKKGGVKVKAEKKSETKVSPDERELEKAQAREEEDKISNKISKSLKSFRGSKERAKVRSGL